MHGAAQFFFFLNVIAQLDKSLFRVSIIPLASVVQMPQDGAINWINRCPAINRISLDICYPLDGDLSSGQCYLPFKQLGLHTLNAARNCETAFTNVNYEEKCHDLHDSVIMLVAPKMASRFEKSGQVRIHCQCNPGIAL